MAVPEVVGYITICPKLYIEPEERTRTISESHVIEPEERTWTMPESGWSTKGSYRKGRTSGSKTRN